MYIVCNTQKLLSYGIFSQAHQQTDTLPGSDNHTGILWYFL